MSTGESRRQTRIICSEATLSIGFSSSVFDAESEKRRHLSHHFVTFCNTVFTSNRECEAFYKQQTAPYANQPGPLFFKLLSPVATRRDLVVAFYE